MLYTYKHVSEAYQFNMQNTDRFDKVQQSMRSVKVVLGERRHNYKMLTDTYYADRRNEVYAERERRAKQKLKRAGAVTPQNKPQFIKEKHKKRKKVALRSVKPRTTEQATAAQ